MQSTSWLQENWVPLAVLGGFVALMVLSAWRANRQRESRPGPVLIALSFYATFLSTNTFLGQAGFGYKVGIAWVLGGVVFVACGFVAWFVVARRMIHDARRVLGDELELDRVTVPGYLRRKYSSALVGYLSAWVVLVASVLYMVAVFKGIGHIVSQILHVPYEVAVTAVFALVVAYTSWGMIRAILHTDAVQGSFMVVGAVALFIATVGHMDWELLRHSSDLDSNGQVLGGALLEWNSLMSPLYILGLSLGTGIKLIVAPRLVVRFLLFRHASERGIQRAKWLAMGLMAVTIPILFLVGILAHGIVPQGQSQYYFENTDQVVPFLVEHLFGPFWGALILGSFLCAALSSIDSVLHVAGSALVVDLWGEWKRDVTRVRLDRLQRVSMIPVAALPAWLALDPPADVVPMTALSGALFGGCFFPALIVGLWWRKASRRAVPASIIAGAAGVIVWAMGLREALDLQVIHPLFAGLFASLITYAGASPFSGPPADSAAAASRASDPDEPDT